MPNPPAAAETLLRALLTPASAETMTGDLLEEYRDRRVPALGRLRADFWYVRQVIGVFLRAYGWFAAPLILWMVAHDLFNTFRDTSGSSYLDTLPAAPLGPVVGIGVLLAAAAYGSWRTERWHGGVVATAGLFIVLWLFMAFWWTATFYPVAQVQQTNPYWIHAWQWSIHRAHPPTLFGFNPDTPDETFLRWIFWDNIGGLIIGGMALCVVSGICGVVGSTVSWTCRRLVAR